jgi:hypothetical protein
MSDMPERIWYNGTTLHARELRWRPPESDAHPQIEYVSADAMKAQIDAAVKAERERCAERFANHDFICMKHYAKGWRHDVYDAIRKGDQP